MAMAITRTCIEGYARIFERHRRMILWAVILATLVAIYGITRLTFNDDIVKLFVVRQGGVEAGVDIGRRTDRAVLVMLEADELFSAEGLRAIWQASEGLKQVEGVIRVASLYDLRTPKRIGRRRTFTRVLPPPDASAERIERAKRVAMQHPMAKEQLIAKDGKATLMLLEVDPQWTTTQQLQSLLKSIKQKLAAVTEGTRVKASVTGVPAIRVELAEATVRDELTFNIAGPLVAIAIAFIVFRRIASVAVVVAGAVLGVVWTMGLLGLAGEPINPINAVVAPLALTIGLADSVHMLMHIREERGRGADRLRAAAISVAAVGFPSALTSITSAVGFVSLGIAELDVLARFGICSAVAVVVAFGSIMTVVPLLGSSALGDHLQVRKKSFVEERPDRLKWHTRLVGAIVDHPTAVLIGSIAITVAALYIGGQVRTDPRVAHGLPTSGETLRAFRRIETEFGGTLPLVASVSWSADSRPTAAEVYAAIADVHHLFAKAAGDHRVAEDQPIAGPPVSLVSLYESMAAKDQNPKSLFQQAAKIPEKDRKTFFDSKLRRSLVVARCRDAGGHSIDALLTDIEQQLAQLEQKHPGFHFQVIPTLLQGLRASTMIVHDLVKSLIVAVPLTLIVIMIALQSFRAGMIALLPNIFPMAALAATMVLCGQSITLTGAAVFVMCFGIAVDDTIHTISAFGRNVAEGKPVKEAIIATYRHLGDAVISTTAILVGGLGVVILGQSYFTRMFGVMFCLGLLWALVGDLVILPAILARFGKSPGATGSSEAPAKPVA